MHDPLRLFGRLLIVASLGIVALPVQAAPRCFPETNQCLDGRILQYWDSNGGLPVFGFPITPQAPELNRDTNQTYETQWMERNRFELHPENAAPYDVLLGRLGDDRLRQLNIDWQTLPKADPNAPHYFPQTGHAVTHEPFWQYWRSHGLDLGDPGISERESLALFGLPLTEARVETNTSGDTVLTQWFERARFEYHPNNPYPYKVLLGLLGNEIRGSSAPAPVPPTTPEPSPSPSAAPSPAPLPPSFNNCQEDPNAGSAPNRPIRIVSVDKVAETVTIRNETMAAVDVTGWRICSIRGNQLHATLSGTIQGGQQLDIPSQADGNIWSNSDDDDASLYDAAGSLISFLEDPTRP
jgi:hypothetical protein